MIFEKHRKIIKEFIDDEIDAINMYWGDDDDLVLEITTQDAILAFEIEDFASNTMGLDTTNTPDPTTDLFKVACFISIHDNQ